MSRLGRPFAKDPSVIRFRGRYLLYYSVPPYALDRLPASTSNLANGWAVGIAESQDLDRWTTVGYLTGEPGGEEAKGIAAPGARILDGRVHLFYQTYGNWRQDAICHAVSDDGVRFERNPTNPIFRPSGPWNAGRAIDAEAFPHEGRLLLYYATRDPEMKVQMLGVAAAPLGSGYRRHDWTDLCVSGPLLRPTLPWERDCIEAPTVCRHGDRLILFYAGGYNNAPQQIGAAASTDGVRWERLSTEPILPNGAPGSWNASESGHPGVFVDEDGSDSSRIHLFFQGNNDDGETWYLSRQEVRWGIDGVPSLVPPSDASER